MSIFDFVAQGKDAQGLYTEMRGHGEETLVFIAGLGGTTRYWAPRIKYLENSYRIVLVDLLGFGESPKPWTRYSTSRHVDALHDALGTLGPVSLVGHSLGALLTVAYAARHPQQVKNIILIGMPYFGTERRAYQYFRKGPVKGGYIYTNIVLTMAACIVTRRILGRLLPYMIRTVPREVAEDLVKHTWRSSTSSLWAVVYDYDAAPDLGSLPPGIGVLFIHGARDVMAPVGAIESLAALQPHWQLQVLADVDHHPFLRNPRGCLVLIDALISATRNPSIRVEVPSIGPPGDQ
jgi:pimeloyl-ACP methyl ester carboxylesterase